LIFNNFHNADNIRFYTSDKVVVTQVLMENRILFDWKSVLLPSTNSENRQYNVIVNKLDKINRPLDIAVLDVVPVEKDNIEPATVSTITETSIEEYQQQIIKMKAMIEHYYFRHQKDKTARQLWKIFYKECVDPFAELSYAYSMTVHKSQGSTFANLLVDMSDITDNKLFEEMKRALYTAASRAGLCLAFIC
jgi:hypothetical protein